MIKISKPANKLGQYCSQPVKAPNPLLKSLGILPGTWTVSGETHGQITFSWMEGGFFMVQDIYLIGTKGIEFIGFDEESATLRSHYFDDKGNVLECTYQVTDTSYIVLIDMPCIKGNFYGTFSNDGNTITGEWRCIKDGIKISSEAVLNKINQIQKV